MLLWEQILKDREAGRPWDFETITEEQLKRLYWDEGLSNNRLAELFNVPKSRVLSKRKKYGLTFHDLLFGTFVTEKLPKIRDILDNKE